MVCKGRALDPAQAVRVALWWTAPRDRTSPEGRYGLTLPSRPGANPPQNDLSTQIPHNKPAAHFFAIPGLDSQPIGYYHSSRI